MRKEKLTPSGTPALSRLIKIGIEEQEQKGVIAPNSAATALDQSPPRPIQSFKRCSGNQLRSTPIAKIITAKSRKILTLS
jgi:hypothetical protein